MPEFAGRFRVGQAIRSVEETVDIVLGETLSIQLRAVQELFVAVHLVGYNFEVRQDWSTADMIYNFAESVAFLSKYIDLAPGDILCSGTGAGTASESGVDGNRWLQPGDRVEAEVEGIGVLANTIAEWHNG